MMLELLQLAAAHRSQDISLEHTSENPLAFTLRLFVGRVSTWLLPQRCFLICFVAPPNVWVYSYGIHLRWMDGHVKNM